MTRFHRPFLEPGQTPILDVEEYVRARNAWQEVHKKLYPYPQVQGDEFQKLAQLEMSLWSDFKARLPFVLISICPYCQAHIWLKFGIFSLQDEYWYLDEGTGKENTFADTLCEHLFCIDGALNLGGLAPTDGTGSIHPQKRIVIAAEVPFVKPRVLNLPTMLAVVHAVPVADRYTAYFVTYFAEETPRQREFCIPFARTAYHGPVEGFESDAAMTGRRADVQDYDLRPWIEKKKVWWLSEDEQTVRTGAPEEFPYLDVAGRRHPYAIEDGRVYDLPDPTETEPEMELETFI